jgi:glycosyltransferase involved in cell wall biosynthesis
LDKLPAPPFPERVLRFAARKAGWDRKEGESKVKKFLQQHGVSVAMGEWLDCSLPWFEVARSLGIRFFGHAHGYDVSTNLCNPSWRTKYLAYSQADGLITVNEMSKTKLVELGLDADKIHVIPCGVDVPSIPRICPERETVNCLVVARMVEIKGPILALDAFRRASDACPNLRLDWVGEGELLPAAQQFVRAFNLESRVAFHGGQPSEFVLGLMKQADMFLQHSITEVVTRGVEGLPVAILEAMANSLPIVATRNGGIPEAVVEGSTGLLVDEGDSKAMAERIVDLARDAALRHRLGHAGWRRAAERFSWDKEREHLLHVMGLNEEPTRSLVEMPARLNQLETPRSPV